MMRRPVPYIGESVVLFFLDIEVFLFLFISLPINVYKYKVMKKEKYELLLKQAKALTAGEIDTIANLANLSALFKDTFDFLWVGFYLVKGKELVLGPFQGPVACTRIHYGKGVCGMAWKERRVIIVPDVEKFPGHIACSSLSRSEIVVPIYNDNEVVGVLDIDSKELETFDEIDASNLKYLFESAVVINNKWFGNCPV
jgi:GAF domain-containing protein